MVALVIKNPTANVGEARGMGLIPELERFPRVGKGSTLQYSCLGNPMNRGAWWASVHEATKSQT